MEGRQRPGISGKRLATVIVLIGVIAALAGLLFREFTPPAAPPSTQPLPPVQVTR